MIVTVVLVVVMWSLIAGFVVALCRVSAYTDLATERARRLYEPGAAWPAGRRERGCAQTARTSTRT
jgi:hypothetical protein